MAELKEEIKTEYESLQDVDHLCPDPDSPAPDCPAKPEVKEEWDATELAAKPEVKEEWDIYMDPDSDVEFGSGNENGARQQVQEDIASVSQSLQFDASSSNLADMKTQRQQSVGSVCRPCSVVLHRVAWQTLDTADAAKDIIGSTRKTQEDSASSAKSFECTACYSKFTDRRTLSKHKTGKCKKSLTRSSKMAERVKCDDVSEISSKRFSSGTRNKAQVASQPQHECSVCHKRLSSKSNLNNHMAIHLPPQHECKICLKRFAKKGGLKIHMATHLPPQHECNICFKLFVLKSDLKAHVLNVHQGVKPFACQYCDKRFPKQCKLNTHELSHTGEKPFSCTVCNKRFPLRSGLAYHMAFHMLPQFQCDVCFKKFKQKSSLNEHVSAVHQGVKPFACQQCDKTFPNRTKLNYHSISHMGEKSFACEICFKSYASRGTLTVHMATHMKPQFQCDVCSKRFTQKVTLKNHINSHSLPQHECNICQKRFALKFSLDCHVLSVHEGGKPFACKLCDLKFTSKRFLNVHRVTHTGRESFLCDVCPKSFSLKGDLKLHKARHAVIRHPCNRCKRQFKCLSMLNKHMVSHKDQQEHKCKLCNKKFPQNFQLQMHQWRHTGEKPFCCDICQIRYSFKGSLKRHMVSHFAEEAF